MRYVFLYTFRFSKLIRITFSSDLRKPCWKTGKSLSSNSKLFCSWENSYLYCSRCFQFHQTQPKGQIIHHEIYGKSWEVTEADMFSLYKEYYLCPVDYHSKFPFIKKRDSLYTDSFVWTCKVILLKHGLPKKIMSDSGSYFVSQKFWEFCTALSSSCTTRAMDR